MKSIVAVNPFDCRLWDLHDRLEASLTEESCRAEIESFAKHGQLIPALGRPLVRDPTHKIELICGARRLFVARHINVPLLVELREMSDREAIIAMDVENRQRTDISPYERGMSYARWLRSGHFRSQEDIAHTLKVSASQVSRLLRFAHLPAVIIDAFENPATICEGWGLDILQSLEDPKRRQATINAARSIASMATRPPPREVYRRLVSPVSNGQRLKKQAHDEVVKDGSGRPLYRIRHQSSSIAFLLPLNKVAPDVLNDLRQLVSGVLQRAAQNSNGCVPSSPEGELAPRRAVRSDQIVRIESLTEKSAAERRAWSAAATMGRVASPG